jgi:tetratricopeptide (TPR) repeat protein
MRLRYGSSALRVVCVYAFSLLLAEALASAQTSPATTNINCGTVTEGSLRVPAGSIGVNVRFAMVSGTPVLCDPPGRPATDVVIRVTGPTAFEVRWTPDAGAANVPSALAPGTYRISIASSCRTCVLSASVDLEPAAGRGLPVSPRPPPKAGTPETPRTTPSPEIAQLLATYRERLQKTGLHEQFTRQASDAEGRKVSLTPEEARTLRAISESFLRDLAAPGRELTLRDLQTFRDATKAASGGDLLFPGQRAWDATYLGTERALMAGRTELVQAAWTAALQDFFKAHPEAVGVVYGRIDIGSWVKNTLGGLSFAGDIDFSSVSVSPELNLILRERFAARLAERTGMGMVEADALLTAHGQATADVFIGDWGKAFAEIDMLKRSSWSLLQPEMKDGKLVLDAEGNPIIREVPRRASDLFWEQAFRSGEEVRFPEFDLDKEPMFSLEMLRHGEHDVARGPFQRGQKIVKMLKYVERSYFLNKKAVAEYGWNPYSANDPLLANVAEQVLQNKNNPAVLAALMESLAGGEITEQNVDAVADRIMHRATIAMGDNGVRALAFRLQKIAGVAGDLERELAAHKLWRDLNTELEEFRRSGIEEPAVMRQAAGLAADLIEGRLSPEDMERRAADLNALLNDAYKLPVSVIDRVSLWGPILRLRVYLRSQMRWKDEQIARFIESARQKYPQGTAVFEALHKATVELNAQLEKTTAGSGLMTTLDYADNAFQIYDAYLTGKDQSEKTLAAARMMGRIALLRQFPSLQIPAGLYDSLSEGSVTPAAMAVTFTYFPFLGQAYMVGTLSQRVNVATTDAAFYSELTRMLANVDVNQEGRITRFVLRNRIGGAEIDTEDVNPPGDRNRIVAIFDDPLSAFFVAPNFRYWRSLVPTPDDEFGRYEDKLEKLRRFFGADENIQYAALMLLKFKANSDSLPQDDYADLRQQALRQMEAGLRRSIWVAMADALESAARSVSMRAELEAQVRAIEADLGLGDDRLGRGKGLLGHINEEIGRQSSLLAGENPYAVGPIFDRYLKAYGRIQAIRRTILFDIWGGRFHVDSSAAQTAPLKILLDGRFGAPALTGVLDDDVALAEACLTAHRARGQKILGDLRDALARAVDDDRDREHLRRLGQLGFEWEHLLDGYPGRSAAVADETGDALGQRLREYRAYLAALAAPALDVAIDGPASVAQGERIRLTATVKPSSRADAPVPGDVRVEWFRDGALVGRTPAFDLGTPTAGVVDMRADAVRDVAGVRKVLGTRNLRIEIKAAATAASPSESAPPNVTGAAAATPDRPTPPSGVPPGATAPAPPAPSAPATPLPASSAVTATSPGSTAGTFSASLTSNWEGGNTPRGFVLRRSPAKIKGPCGWDSSVAASIEARFSQAAKPKDAAEASALADSRFTSRRQGDTQNDPAVGLFMAGGLEGVSGFAMGAYQGAIADFALWMRRGSWGAGYTGSYFGANGVGEVVKQGGGVISFSYHVSGGGCWDNSDRAFLVSQGAAAQAEARAILASLRLDDKGLLTSRPYDGPKYDGSDLAKVRLVPSTLDRLKVGETVTLEAVVENAKPEDSPFTYNWGGTFDSTPDAAKKSNTVRVTPTKPGTYTTSVSVDGGRFGLGSASVSYSVADYRVTIERVETPNQPLVIGSSSGFKATLTVDGASAAANVIYRWEPSTELEWSPAESAQAQAKAVFTRPGPTRVWVVVLEQNGEVLTTVAESNQIDIDVVAPTLTLRATPQEPNPGQEVRVTLTVTPPAAADLLDLRWEHTGAAISPGPLPGLREFTFAPKDVSPVTATVYARARGRGDEVGKATVTVTAKAYDVTVTGPILTGPAPRQWDAKAGGLVDVARQFLVFQQASMNAALTPAPTNTPRYAWTVAPDGCTLSNPISQTPTISCTVPGSFNVSVLVTDASGATLGTGSQSVSVAPQAGATPAAPAAPGTSTASDSAVGAAKRKEAADNVARAKEIVRKGELDEAIALVDGGATTDPTNTEARTLGTQWKQQRDTCLAQVEKTKQLMAGGRYAEASNALVIAKNLHPLYTPVLDTDARLSSEWRAWDSKIQRDIAEIRMASERKEFKRALDLAAARRAEGKIGPYEQSLADQERWASRWEAEKEQKRQLLRAGEEKIRQRDDAGALRDFELGFANFNNLWAASDPEPAYYYKLRDEALARSRGVSAPVGVGDRSTTSSAAAFITQGADLYEKGNHQQAVDAFNRALEARPDSAEAHAGLCLARLGLRDNAGALTECEKALQLDPRNADAYRGRSMIKRATNDAQGALADANRAVELAPSNYRAYLTRGLAREGLNDQAGALADYEGSIAINPDYAMSYYYRGRAKYGRRDYAGAIGDYDRAIQMDPAYASSFFNRARARYAVKDYAAALADYDRYIAMNAANSGAFNNRALVKERLGDAAGAIADFERAIAIDPNYETAKKNLATLRERLRQPNTPPSASPGPSSLKSGRYHMRANEYPSDVILTVNGSAFTGRMLVAGIERAIRNGVISGDAVTFHLDIEGFPQGQDYKGRIQGGRITGTFTGAPYALGVQWWSWGLDLTPAASTPPATTKPPAAVPPRVQKPAAAPSASAPKPVPEACQVTGAFEVDTDEGRLTLTLRQSGDQLDGTLAMTPKGEETTRVAVRGSFARPAISLTATLEGESMPVYGTASSDCRSIRVRITFDDETETLTLVKKM